PLTLPDLSPLSLHDALPISGASSRTPRWSAPDCAALRGAPRGPPAQSRVATTEGRTCPVGARGAQGARRSTTCLGRGPAQAAEGDRKSTRLNSSHRTISYAV